MTAQRPGVDTQANIYEGGITRIIVGGFKSIAQEQSIEIRPLTILAGANSSGKSSMMQPLLLLKQTLNAQYDPGVLLLNGPNVKFTLVDQLLPRIQGEKSINDFHVGVHTASGMEIKLYFKRNEKTGFNVERADYVSTQSKYTLYPNMSQKEIQNIFPEETKALKRSFINLQNTHPQDIQTEPNIFVRQDRFFLVPAISNGEGLLVLSELPPLILRYNILQTLHLPGLRGNPERDYSVTAAGPTFPGTFEIYVASIIERWQQDNDKQRLARLYNDLAHLSLTNKIIARRKNDTAIELVVNRLRQSNQEDMVSIADVGLGVSQALPVVVALHTANPGQLVYIEQPEIHLHPRAQYAMAEVLAEAAKEGKKIVIETHSSLLLMGIQTLVAEGKLPPELVKLHWFTLQADGSTNIDSANLDERGAFGDWAEDFDDVALYSEGRFLDAQARLRENISE